MISALAVPCNVIHPWKCLVQCNLMQRWGAGWIFWSINITSVPVFCLLSPSSVLVAKSHSFLQFLGGNQHAARVPPIIFHPCLVCAQKLFAFARKLFLNLRGKRHVSNMIFSILAKKWSLACGRSCACSVNNNLRYVAAALFSAEDKIFFCCKQIFSCHQQIFQYTINKYKNLWHQEICGLHRHWD